MSKRPSKADPAPIEEQPQTGGSYIRMPDGSLVREEPVPAEQPTEPAADSAAPSEQEA
ncbi:MAG: hypothetical protein U9R07_17255 [Pseudomonadota bacterium]|nr:hypothetical protein [Pseudomonadota bacterium]